MNQVDHFPGVRHGVGPAALGGAQERLRALRVVEDLPFGRDQAVPVEVDAVVQRIDDQGRNARMPQEVGLAGQVGAHGVHAPGHEVGRVPGVGDDLHGVQGHALGGEHGRDLHVCRRGHHDALPMQVVGGTDSPVPQGQEHVRRMLENGGQHHQGFALAAPYQDRRRFHGEFGLAGQQAVRRLGPGSALQQFHVEALFAEKPMLQGRVIPGELELVAPFELQADLCGGRGAQGRAGAEHEHERQHDGGNPPGKAHQLEQRGITAGYDIVHPVEVPAHGARSRPNSQSAPSHGPPPHFPDDRGPHPV